MQGLTQPLDSVGGDIKEAETYTREADRRRLAKSAIWLIDIGEIGTGSVTPFPAMQSGVTKKGS